MSGRPSRFDNGPSHRTVRNVGYELVQKWDWDYPQAPVEAIWQVIIMVKAREPCVS